MLTVRCWCWASRSKCRCRLEKANSPGAVVVLVWVEFCAEKHHHSRRPGFHQRRAKSRCRGWRRKHRKCWC